MAFPVIGQTFTHKNSKIKHNITMLRRYFIYGNLGIFMEVFWTGMQSFIKRGDICLTGTTSVIMFFIYTVKGAKCHCKRYDLRYSYFCYRIF